MFIFLSVIVIACVSIALSFLSLKHIEKGLGHKETAETKESLKQERVIFHSSDVSSSDSTS